MTVNSPAQGRRVAARFVTLQLALASVAALPWLLSSAFAALSAWVGGLIVASGTLVFAWRHFGAGLAPARVQLRATFAAEGIKWLWLGLWIFVAIAVWQLLPLPFLLGMLITQAGHFIGLLIVR